MYNLWSKVARAARRSRTRRLKGCGLPAVHHTVGDNKKLTLRFVARSFCSACVIVLAPSSHTVAPSRDRFNVRVIVITKRNN